MEININQRAVKIIAEVHPQFFGSFSELERMILMCKLGGADCVKVQLYNSKQLFNNQDRKFLEINENELIKIKEICDKQNIELSASIFGLEQLEWCKKINLATLKIASRTLVDDINLCKKIIKQNKKTIISLGMFDYHKNELPFKEKNIQYLYCISKYPCELGLINMPDFDNSFFDGFSDHTYGISAAVYAVSKGAKIIEKHFSTNKAQNVDTQMGHLGSMDYNDLINLRRIVDDITLIKSNSN